VIFATRPVIASLAHSCPLEEREVAYLIQICLNERESREKKALKERERGERE
jgi:hypothetical protein